MSVLFRDVLKSAVQKMKEEGISDASTDAWLLSEYVLGITKHKYYMDRNLKICEADAEKYIKQVDRRISHVPLQYITGSQEFMGLNFKVNQNVLIPRQDTELLAERAIREIKKRQSAVKVLDLCTGSGCIAVSIAKYCENAEVSALDISEKALEIAEENAKENNVKIHFIQSDLFEKVSGKYDFIVSNPPYIPTSVVETLEIEVKGHEPLLALDGDADGLVFYRRIAEDVPQYLTGNGMVMIEIGYNQGEAVSCLLRKKASYVTVYKDLAGHDRLLVAKGVRNM